MKNQKNENYDKKEKSVCARIKLAAKTTKTKVSLKDVDLLLDVATMQNEVLDVCFFNLMTIRQAAKELVAKNFFLTEEDAIARANRHVKKDSKEATIVARLLKLQAKAQAKLDSQVAIEQ